MTNSLPTNNYLKAAALTSFLAIGGCATMLPTDGVIPQSGERETESQLSPVVTMKGIEKADLLNQIKRNFELPNYQSNLVTKYENWYRTHPTALPKILTKAEWSIPWIFNEITKIGFPAEIALLPVIESGYDPSVRSRQNAQGLWQLIKNTGKHYGLNQNQWIDERRDIEKSTKAALTYLSELNEIFNGDWMLTLAAYNSGQGRIKRQIAENINSGGSGHYKDLALITETRHFVPKLIAVRNIIRNPEHYGVVLPTVPTQRNFVTVPVVNGVSHKAIAKTCNIDQTTIKILNAAHQRAGAPPGRQIVRIPETCDNRFRHFIKDHSEHIVEHRQNNNTSAYIVKKGDSLWSIARRNKTTISSILQKNPGLKESLQPGQSIVLTDSGIKIKKNRTYTIKSGDTLSHLAKRFQVKQTELAKWNNMNLNSILTLGQKLLIR